MRKVLVTRSGIFRASEESPSHRPGDGQQHRAARVLVRECEILFFWSFIIYLLRKVYVCVYMRIR